MLLHGLAHPGVHAFAREYLGEEAQPVPFVGRAPELAELCDFVSAEGTFALVVAPAGRGKSALVLRFAERLEASGHAVAWLPVSLRFGTHRSATLDALLSARLRVLRGQSGHWRDLLAAGEGRPLLLVIDGLDELQDSSFLDSLRGLDVPAGVQIVAAARTLLDCDAAGWAERLGWADCRLLEPGPLGLAEVTAALTPAAAAQAGALWQRTGGDPLLLRLCMEAMDKGEPLPDVADPAELVGAWWAEQRARMQAPEDARATRALAGLAAACGVVPWAVLGAVTGDGEEGTRSALSGFGRFVREVDDQGVTFAHPRFAEVARWSLAAEVQAAQRRYGELVGPSRAGDNPSAYWLHFGRAHLEAIGAPDGAFAALLNRSSLNAWRRLEGDVTGAAVEAKSLWDRAVQTLAREWGGPGANGAVEHAAQALTMQSLLKEIEQELTPALRVALVSHGLRSVESAIVSAGAVSNRGGFERKPALAALVPLVTERSLPVLLSLSRETGWPRDEVIAWLHARGMSRLALDVLLEAPEYMAESLVLLAPSLPAEEVARGVEAILRCHGSTPFAMRYNLPLLPLLSADSRQHLLEEVRQRVLLPEVQWNLETDVILCEHLATDRAAAGDLPGARRWIDHLESRVRLVTWGHEQPEFWDALARAGRTLTAAFPGLLPACEALVDRLMARLPTSPRAWAPLLRWNPRPDWLAVAEKQAEERHWDLELDPFGLRGWRLAENPLPERWWPRVEQAELAAAREKLARGELPVAVWMVHFALHDREGFFDLVPAWLDLLLRPSGYAHPGQVESGDRLLAQLTVLAQALARQGGIEGDPRARRYLDEAMVNGAHAWEIEGWEQIWPLEQRRAILERHLLKPVYVKTPGRECQQLFWYLSRATEQKEEGFAGLTSLTLAVGRGRPEAAHILVRCSPPEEHAALVEELVLSQGKFRCPVADLLAALPDAGLQERVARHFLAHQGDERFAEWPASLFAALPASEREGAERAFVARLRARGQQAPLAHHTPAWLWGEWVEGWISAGRSWLDLVDDSSHFFHIFSALQPHLRGAVIEALPTAPDESQESDSLHPCWRTLDSLLGYLPEADVLLVACEAGRMSRSLHEKLIDRAWVLFTMPLRREKSRKIVAPLPIEAAAERPAPRLSEPLRELWEAWARRPESGPVNRGRLSLWQDAGRPGEEQLRRALAASEGIFPEHWIPRACGELGRQDLWMAYARHELTQVAPERQLGVLHELMERVDLTLAERASFSEEIQRAARVSSTPAFVAHLFLELDDATALTVWPQAASCGWHIPSPRLLRRTGAGAAEAWVRGMIAAYAALVFVRKRIVDEYLKLWPRDAAADLRGHRAGRSAQPAQGRDLLYSPANGGFCAIPLPDRGAFHLF